jgi:hypothetical protein
MKKFREHRGSLADSMKTVVEVNGLELQQLCEKITGLDSWIEIRPYGYDDRIGWDTYIVLMPGWGVVGFTNGVPDLDRLDKPRKSVRL